MRSINGLVEIFAESYTILYRELICFAFHITVPHVSYEPNDVYEWFDAQLHWENLKRQNTMINHLVVKSYFVLCRACDSRCSANEHEILNLARVVNRHRRAYDTCATYMFYFEQLTLDLSLLYNIYLCTAHIFRENAAVFLAIFVNFPIQQKHRISVPRKMHIRVNKGFSVSRRSW